MTEKQDSHFAPRSQQPDGYAVVRDGVSFVGIWTNVEAASQVSGIYPNSEVRPMVYAVSEKGTTGATPRTDASRHNMGSVTEPHYVVDAEDYAILERENADLRGQLAKHERRYIDITMLTPHTEVAKIAFAGLAAIKEST